VSKFKVGDRVLILKPKDVSIFPEWTPDMNYLHGTVGEISVGEGDNLYTIKGAGWWLCETWLQYPSKMAKAIYE